MKILKKLRNLILFILVLLCAFVFVCALNPSFSKTIGEKIVKIRSLTEVGNTVDNISLVIPDVNGYISPTQDSLVVPDEVSDKNGYEPVWEDTLELDENEASQLQSDLDEGDTGEQYTFDKLYYPYYHMLNSEQQKLYRQIYANALQCNESFAPNADVRYSQIKDVFEAVYNDHPELFWLETGYVCKYMKDGKVVELKLQYNSTAEKLEYAKELFEQAANEIIQGASALGSVTEAEKYVHDILVEKVEYVEGAPMNQSAYSALVTGKSVCAGYSRAFQYIMIQMHIPCYYCVGYSGETHAWNIIKIDNAFYNVDVTWDDTNPSTYDYYNKSDSEYSKTHMRSGLSVNLPACVSVSNDQNMNTESDNNANATGDTTDLSGDTNDDISKYINPNPSKPLTLEDEKKDSQTTEDDKGDIDTMKEYYADCLAKMVEAGKGQKQFVVVIAESLWDSIEKTYSDGSYKKGYVNEALKKMEVTNFAIQLQAQRLGNGYYKLYHNIATW